MKVSVAAVALSVGEGSAIVTVAPSIVCKGAAIVAVGSELVPFRLVGTMLLCPFFFG